MTEWGTKPTKGPMAWPVARPAPRAAAGRGVTWWLISKAENGRTEVLTLRPNCERRTLPVFGFRDEAEMFLKLDGLGDGWRARESSGGELASMLDGPYRGIQSVAIDPVPDVLRDGTTLLVSVDSGRFLERLAGSSPAHFLGNGNGRGRP